jgi:hypothetical protein
VSCVASNFIHKNLKNLHNWTQFGLRSSGNRVASGVLSGLYRIVLNPVVGLIVLVLE